MNDIAHRKIAEADVAAYMHGIGEAAREAARALARADTRSKNEALRATAASLRRNARQILDANARDVEAARMAKHDEAFVDRLALTG
jgi:glutamate-5-semialdehyde dehydrogenase